MTTKRHYVSNIVDTNELATTPEKSRFLTTVLIPLGSVLLAGLSLLAKSVPWWVTTIVVLYIAVITIALVIPAVIRIYGLVNYKITQRAIMRRYVPVIRQFLVTLLPSLEDSRSETISYVWRTASSLDNGRRIVQMNYLYRETLQNWFASPGAPSLSMARRDSSPSRALRARRVDLPAASPSAGRRLFCGPANSAGPQWLYASRGSATADYAPSASPPWRAAEVAKDDPPPPRGHRGLGADPPDQWLHR